MTMTTAPTEDAPSASHSSLNLRQYIETFVGEAVKQATAYKPSSEQDSKQSVEIWTQLVTDRIIGAFRDSLPEPVDVAAKYEMDPLKSFPVTITGNFQEDDEQLKLLAKFSTDQGQNLYYFKLANYLDRLYTT